MDLAHWGGIEGLVHEGLIPVALRLTSPGIAP